MSKYWKAAIVFASVALGAASGQAQQIAMYGEYGEANGIIVNIPQNPPILPCTPDKLTVLPPAHATVMGTGAPQQHLKLRPAGVHNAKCITRGQFLNLTNVKPLVFNAPRVGNKGARNINPAGAGLGLAVGDPFTIPPFAFAQQLGPQIGQVLKSDTRQLDTTFIAAMPGIDRHGPHPGPLPNAGGTPLGGEYTIKLPAALGTVPALTRMFSQMNFQNAGNGWNNDLPVGQTTIRSNMLPNPNPKPNRIVAGGANASHTNQAAGGNEKVQVKYKAGPRQFGGTMALLLDGKGRLYLKGPSVTGKIPAQFQPAVGTLPVGDNDPGFRRRNAAGWNVTLPGFQAPGLIKGYQGNTKTEMLIKPLLEPVCTVSTNPLALLPVNCNLVNGFNTYMRGVAPLGPSGILAQIPKATSIKHVFGLTTGTVSIYHVAQRDATHFSDTLTAMGYDTIGVSVMGGPQRNVGLVAGSYTIRASTTTQINIQMLGLNLKFTPEPGATAALASGLSMLGFLAYRRRA